MAIVKLSKFRLYGMNEDKDSVIDVLYKSKLLHIKNIDNVKGVTKDFDETKQIAIKNKMQKVQKVIEYYQNLSGVQSIDKIEVNEDEFHNFEKNNPDIISKIDNINEILELAEEKKRLILELKNDKERLENQKISSNETEKSIFILDGTIETCKIESLKSFLETLNFSYYEVSEKGKVEIISNEEEKILVEEKAVDFNLKLETLNSKMVSIQLYESYTNLVQQYNEKSLREILKNGNSELNLFKIYYDYLNYSFSKLELNKDLGFTKKTFILEGYLEETQKETLENLIKSKNLKVSYEFMKPEKDDDVPTKTKNKKFIKPFEFVTNMYSVPKYNELDPNFWVGLFFSLFFGFIMADIGYGILLLGIGLFFVLKKNASQGLKSLMKVVAIGGVFAIFFGVLFGSFLGYTHDAMPFVPKAVLPDPSKNVMMYLIASVVIGAVQIMVGFALKGILLLRRKKIGEAICSAFAWDIFFIGAGIFALDILKITNGLMMVGLIVALFGVATAVIGNIFINKGFERVSKSFGSLYSILNLFSDLLSYTRLFGLMLSGVIIASIVNQLAGGFYTVAWKIPFGILISLIGHAFNISMGALGAYIHDARLQYIEFFSRFYEGEGELFTPFGSNYSYIKLIEKVED